MAPPSSAQGGPPFLGPPSYPLPVAAAANRGLHLKGVPDDLNNHPFLQNHFSTFGPVESIECFPQKRWAKVTFKRRVGVATFPDVTMVIELLAYAEVDVFALSLLLYLTLYLFSKAV